MRSHQRYRRSSGRSDPGSDYATVTKPINDPNLAGALAAAYGLKGRVIISLDEVAVPAISVGSLDGTPYDRLETPAVTGFSSPAVAARNAGVAIVPGAGNVSKVTNFLARNQTAGALDYVITWMTAAQLAAVNQSATTNFFTQNPYGQTGAALVDAATQLIDVDAAGVSGRVITRVSVAAGASELIPMPGGLFLYGNNANAGAIGFWCATVNTTFNGSVWVVEYRLPG